MKQFHILQNILINSNQLNVEVFRIVGASQSDGKRLFTGAKGKDYIAAFSSRGPTYDGKLLHDFPK